MYSRHPRGDAGEVVSLTAVGVETLARLKLSTDSRDFNIPDILCLSKGVKRL